MRLKCININDVSNQQIYENVDSVEQSVLSPHILYIFFKDGSSITIHPHNDFLYCIDFD